MTDTHDNLHRDWDAMHHDQPSYRYRCNARHGSSGRVGPFRRRTRSARCPTRRHLPQADEEIVIVLHPGFDTLDAIGPHYFLSSMLGATIHIATTEQCRSASR